MTTSENFSEYYKTISNTELLSILDNPGDYQLLAIEAAKQEFALRQLSDTEIQAARQPLIARQVQNEKEQEKVKVVKTKIRAAGNTFIDTINPIQTGISSTEKIIRFIVIVFGGFFLYQFIKDFKTHLFYLENFLQLPFGSSLYLFPLVILPIGTFMFWKRKRIGWTLLTIFLTFSAVSALWLLLQSLTWKSSGFDQLDSLFPRPSPVTYILQLLFLFGVLYVLSKKSIREIFSVNDQRAAVTIGISALMTFFLVLAIS